MALEVGAGVVASVGPGVCWGFVPMDGAGVAARVGRRVG